MKRYAGNRDPRFVAIHRGGDLDLTTHRLLVAWAADCAEHVLPLFTEVDSTDTRPSHAIATAHMADHELGAAAYAIWAAMKSVRNVDTIQVADSECRWQQAQLSDAIRELVLSDQQNRNPKFKNL